MRQLRIIYLALKVGSLPERRNVEMRRSGGGLLGWKYRRNLLMSLRELFPGSHIKKLQIKIVSRILLMSHEFTYDTFNDL